MMNKKYWLHNDLFITYDLGIIHLIVLILLCIKESLQFSNNFGKLYLGVTINFIACSFSGYSDSYLNSFALFHMQVYSSVTSI